MMTGGTDDLLVIEGVASSYAGAVVGLQDVSLRLARGEILAIVGANGAGKTTLLRAIANLLPAQRGRVIRGKIFYRGMDATRVPSDALVRAGLGSVLEGRHCFASLTLEENLLTGAVAGELDRAAARRALDRVYALFPGVAARRRLLAGQVSGGEQQMTAIGRALMGEPSLLLLDEPSMGLAPLVVRAIFDALVALNREEGLSVLLTEQNFGIARRHAHRLHALSGGRSVALAAEARADFAHLFLGGASAVDASTTIAMPARAASGR